MVKKILYVMLCTITITGMFGCGGELPQKPAGPGGERLQPFNPNNGQYAPNK
ncbi:MAG: hypothetical protein N2112_10025 [Gemmataceae bacterium]|jgi:hypothetical protein|nr:hypothetical protein [Gemmataceae bacterium]